MKFDHLSVSRINCYQTCPMQYYFRYVAMEKIPPAGVVMLGWRVHDSVEHNYEQKVESHQDLKVTDVLDHFSTGFDFDKNHSRWMADEKPGKTKDSGVKMLNMYQEKVAPATQPILVEQAFDLELENREWTIRGRIDTMDDKKHLLELKTSGRSKKQVEFSHILQATTYTIGMASLGFPPEAGRIDYLIRTKEPKLQQFDFTPTSEDIRLFLNIATSVARGITADVYPPNRSHFLCSRKWCGFWNLCEKSEGGRVKD